MPSKVVINSVLCSVSKIKGFVKAQQNVLKEISDTVCVFAVQIQGQAFQKLITQSDLTQEIDRREGKSGSSC